MKLRETILNEVSPGVQLHILTAFWNYLLLMEIALMIILPEQQSAYLTQLSVLRTCPRSYETHMSQVANRRSPRLLAFLDGIAARKKAVGSHPDRGSYHLIYRSDIRALNDAIGRYLTDSRKEVIWPLFDILDKGWPIFDVTPQDFAVVELREATRNFRGILADP